MIQATYEDIARCCASESFAKRLSSHSPFADVTALIHASRDIWWNELNIFDWLEAFQAHPRIGDRKPSADDQFSRMSQSEQAMASETSNQSIATQLAEWNAMYEKRFGHIFLIYASGRTANEILSELQKRYKHTADVELKIAASEQQKITEKRLFDVFAAAQPIHSQVERRAGTLAQQIVSSGTPQRSPITTHVLDTCIGRPAPHVGITLEYNSRSMPHSIDTEYTVIGRGVTNNDGRLTDLLQPGSRALAGVYCLTFNMTEYHERCRNEHPTFFKDSPFFPVARIYFTIREDQTDQHFHVPLTWNPFGYSTYRGS